MHGLYLTTPKLDFDRIRRIRESIGIPIVMHGGSGVSDEDFKKCIANGVRKINYYTYLAKAGGMYVKEKCRAAEEYVFSRCNPVGGPGHEGGCAPHNQGVLPSGVSRQRRKSMKTFRNQQGIEGHGKDD